MAGGHHRCAPPAGMVAVQSGPQAAVEPSDSRTVRVASVGAVPRFMTWIAVDRRPAVCSLRHMGTTTEVPPSTARMALYADVRLLPRSVSITVATTWPPVASMTAAAVQPAGSGPSAGSWLMVADWPPPMVTAGAAKVRPAHPPATPV